MIEVFAKNHCLALAGLWRYFNNEASTDLLTLATIFTWGSTISAMSGRT